MCAEIIGIDMRWFWNLLRDSSCLLQTRGWTHIPAGIPEPIGAAGVKRARNLIMYLFHQTLTGQPEFILSEFSALIILWFGALYAMLLSWNASSAFVATEDGVLQRHMGNRNSGKA